MLIFTQTGKRGKIPEANLDNSKVYKIKSLPSHNPCQATANYTETAFFCILFIVPVPTFSISLPPAVHRISSRNQVNIAEMVQLASV